MRAKIKLNFLSGYTDVPEGTHTYIIALFDFDSPEMKYAEFNLEGHEEDSTPIYGFAGLRKIENKEDSK